MKTTLALLLILTAATIARAGTASWYGWDHAGKRMANGRRFNPMAFTCATYEHPLGAVLRVTNVRTGKWVIVTVCDLGPAKRLRREVDLSLAAFRAIGTPRRGLIEVNVFRIR